MQRTCLISFIIFDFLILQGNINFLFFIKSTHLITTQDGFNEASQKVAAAKNLGLHVVSKEFVVDSITQGTKQDEKNYYFVEGATPLPSPTIHSPKGTIPLPFLNQFYSSRHFKYLIFYTP